MTFRQFAFNNVWRNASAYVGYFLSSAISAFLFFTFTAFTFHPLFATTEFSARLQNTLLAVEGIAYVFLCLFIFYSVSVFLKGRLHEFGTLYLIGMTRRQMARLVLVENLLVHGSAIVASIVVGLVFNKLFLLLVSKLFRLPTLQFYLPWNAIALTVGAFLALALLISLFTLAIVREGDLLRLLKGSVQEKKEPKTSPWLALLALGCLGYGYGRAFMTTSETLADAIIPVTAVVTFGTYFFYSQATVALVKRLKRSVRTNWLFLSLANLHYRLRDNTRIFFIVTTTSAVAFCAIGSMFSYWLHIERQEINRTPVPVIVNGLVESFTADPHYIDTITRKLNVKPTVIATTKTTDDKALMAVSDYNHFATMSQLPTVTLKGSTVYVVNHTAPTTAVTIDGKRYNVKKVAQLAPAWTFFPANSYIVADDVAQRAPRYSLVYLYDVDDWQTTHIALKQEHEPKDVPAQLILHDRAFYYYNATMGAGILLFIALFIGLIFFVTTSSFLYNKFYVDVNEDKLKFYQLRRIGLLESELKKMATVELGTLFILPFVVAVIHSIVALSVLPRALDIPTTTGAFVVMMSFFAIQLLYFYLIRKKYITDINRFLALK